MASVASRGPTNEQLTTLLRRRLTVRDRNQIKRDLNTEYDQNAMANDKVSAVVSAFDCDESGTLQEWRQCYRSLLAAPAHPTPASLAGRSSCGWRGTPWSSGESLAKTRFSARSARAQSPKQASSPKQFVMMSRMGVTQ